ncbi:MAG: MarR family winged helix-turn-helix transcriptional regulator [Gemmatimonadota bacterium]
MKKRENAVGPADECQTIGQYRDGRLGPSILCLARLVERRLMHSLARAGLGLTPAQARILVTLHFNGPLSQQELASRLDVEPSTIVGTLDVLERDGLARREPNPSDRRAHVVHMTEAGETLLPSLFGLLDVVDTELVEWLPERERSRLQGSLSRLIERLSAREEAC